ncbi:S-adenosyl-L-methionine-dependent methyltransferase [Chytridium lagenaria]|nr:S-adenosyl-L-methionine-dependent methyltransferase [Chytridium lagenaria]
MRNVQLASRLLTPSLACHRLVRCAYGTTSSIDPEEVAKFGRAAAEWWDPKGQFEMLHKMNPVRVSYIKDKVDQYLDRNRLVKLDKPFEGLKMLDVGCGGGLLAESLSRLGGDVVGLDAAPENVKMAKFHAESDPLLRSPTYRTLTAEELLEETGGSQFDVVCSLEVIEHVNDPKSFVSTLCQLAKPEGVILLSTINRNAASHFLTIFMAEQLLKWVPPGTHEHDKYITPEELTTLPLTQMHRFAT